MSESSTVVDSSAPVLTIDGPSGSGKGTIARLVADELGFHLLDSGAIYRLTALAAHKAGVDWDNEAALLPVAQSLDIEFKTGEDGVKAFLAGEDVSLAIRQELMSLGSSKVAAHPAVREALLERQRAFRRLPGLVADGRDMGTTVFPAATAKVFLTASAEERADRRYEQLIARGESVSLRDLLEDIRARDARDSQRSASPMRPANDALVIDSSGVAIQDVLKSVLHHLQTRLAT